MSLVELGLLRVGFWGRKLLPSGENRWRRQRRIFEKKGERRNRKEMGIDEGSRVWVSQGFWDLLAFEKGERRGFSRASTLPSLSLSLKIFPGVLVMVVGITITAGIHFSLIEAFLLKRPLSFVDSRKDPWPAGQRAVHFPCFFLASSHSLDWIYFSMEL